ncbi:MAG: multicopper oxidase family protein [Actinomycetota bacterium]
MPDSGISRRRALQLLAGAGALAAVGGCDSDTTPTTVTTIPPVTDTTITSPVLEPDVRDLHVGLWAEPSTASIQAGVTTEVFSYGARVIEGDVASVVDSGSYLGPTLHLRQGQRVRVTFENRLDQESIVHWHGLVVPQDQDGQPAEAIPPGETYEYDFVVENRPGTYWYHPHPHHLTGSQVYQGLAGLLVIHGEEGSLADTVNDLALVLQDRTIDPDGQLRYVAMMHDVMAGFVGETLVTNGVAGYEAVVRPEPYRIRILNGANSRTQYLTWSTGDQLHAVATDGALLPKTISVDGLVITPAQRTDLWMDFSQFQPGDRIELLTADMFIESAGMMGGGMGGGGSDDFGLNLIPQTAASFIVGETTPVHGEMPTAPGFDPTFGAEDAVNADAPKEFVLSTRRAAHWINGTQWEGRSVTELETVKAGTVELWDFVNFSPMPHPMHLHGMAFRVVSRTWEDDGLAEAWSGIEDGVIESGVRDTVLVWPGQRVQIAVPFAEHKGFFPYHCHILEHEDGGMMRNFLVI